MPYQKLPEEAAQAIYSAILDDGVVPSFVRATFRGAQRGASIPWEKVVLRPVKIKAQPYVQFAYYDDRKCITKNYRGVDVQATLRELLELPLRAVHVTSTAGELQVTLPENGPVRVLRTKARKVDEEIELSHDRQKKAPLPEGKQDPYLQAIGFMTQDGQIRADKQRKFKQTNEFLKLIQQTGELERLTGRPVQIVDFGCGNAYLTFAVYHYLNHVLKVPAWLVGVDVQGELLVKHALTVKSLGWTDITFDESRIADYIPSAPPDITLALHACDTATDEAIAQGIRYGSRLIVSVPCCHHQMQVQLDGASIPETFRSISRHGILMERWGDILTDAFRALILRIMGYQTDVIQFVSIEHTPRNIMIRSVRSDSAAPPHLIREYEAMKAYWQVTPYLESLLGDTLKERLTTCVETKPCSD